MKNEQEQSIEDLLRTIMAEREKSLKDTSAESIDHTRKFVAKVIEEKQIEDVDASPELPIYMRSVIERLNTEDRDRELISVEKLIRDRNKAHDQLDAYLEKLRQSQDGIIGNMR